MLMSLIANVLDRQSKCEFLDKVRFTTLITNICNILLFTNNRYKSHILVFFCIFAFDYIYYVPISWYARTLSSIRNNQPNLNPTPYLS